MAYAVASHSRLTAAQNESKEPKEAQPQPQPPQTQPEQEKLCAKCGKLFPASDVAGHEHRRLNGHRFDNDRCAAASGARWT